MSIDEPGPLSSGPEGETLKPPGDLTASFGDVALRIVGAQAGDESKRRDSIIGALKRIADDPDSFPEAFDATANVITPDVGAERALDQKSKALQQKIAQAGYLERSFFTDDNMVQLDYSVVAGKQHGLGPKLPEGATLSLKLIPTTLSWDIKQYARWDGYNYRDYRGTREAKFGAFTLLAISCEGDALPKKLYDFQGKVIGLDKVGVGSRLIIQHSFTNKVSELESSPSSKVNYFAAHFPAVFKQAYLGGSSDYPLFLNRGA